MTLKKKFDCVEMMHACQAVVRKRLTGLTREQTLDYWRKRHGEALAEQKRIIASRGASRGPR